MDEDILRAYFANKTRSGGGPIKKLIIDRESNEIYMTFENPAGELS